MNGPQFGGADLDIRSPFSNLVFRHREPFSHALLKEETRENNETVPPFTSVEIDSLSEPTVVGRKASEGPTVAHDTAGESRADDVRVAGKGREVG
jgi:hypothetical protein